MGKGGEAGGQGRAGEGMECKRREEKGERDGGKAEREGGRCTGRGDVGNLKYFSSTRFAIVGTLIVTAPLT